MRRLAFAVILILGVPTVAHANTEAKDDAYGRRNVATAFREATANVKRGDRLAKNWRPSGNGPTSRVIAVRAQSSGGGATQGPPENGIRQIASVPARANIRPVV